MLVVSLLFIFSETVFAHQPRVPEASNRNVSHPDISQAFYSKLEGEDHIYTISSEIPFLLYINIVVPDILNQKTDLNLVIIRNGDIENPIVSLDGNSTEWTKFFEPYGYDHYLMGPKYEAEVEAEKYSVIVSSETNNIKYSLTVGKTEYFDFKESINALKLIPQIKRDFFARSPINFKYK